jgi:DNA-binding transcriptional LysR family regulator
MSNLTARQLQIFVDAAQTLSFARVADRLHLTPSAVSFQIRQIEQQTGFAVFERIGRRMALTEAGAVLLDYARPVLQALRDIDQAMLVLKGSGQGRVRLGLVSTAKYIVPHMIARFRREAPGVAVSLREGNRSMILSLLLQGGIDLAFMGQPPAGADILAERVAVHPSLIIAERSHPLSRQDVIPAAELTSEWFILREDGSGTRSLSDRFFTDAGFMPRIAMESSSNEMIKQSVMAGMGMALVSAHTIYLERSLGLLSVIPVAGFPVMRSWFVGRRKTAPLLPVQARLEAYLVAHAQGVIDDLEHGPTGMRAGR